MCSKCISYFMVHTICPLKFEHEICTSNCSAMKASPCKLIIGLDQSIAKERIFAYEQLNSQNRVLIFETFQHISWLKARKICSERNASLLQVIDSRDSALLLQSLDVLKKGLKYTFKENPYVIYINFRQSEKVSNSSIVH